MLTGTINQKEREYILLFLCSDQITLNSPFLLKVMARTMETSGVVTRGKQRNTGRGAQSCPRGDLIDSPSLGWELAFKEHFFHPFLLTPPYC